MLDDVGLIHMNGRLYDSFLGRFCSADPYVQSPLNTQNYNRYTYALNNPLSVVDPSGHFFGIVFAIASVISYIVGAVFTAISILIGVVMKAIAAIVLAAKVLITEAVKFTIGVLKTSFGWMKSVGSKLITSVKAGWSQGISSMMAVKGKTVALGAATNAAWSGIQTARHGGSWKDIFRSAVKGAVIGAIGAVTGAFMHGFGAGVGSFASGGGSLTGTVMHAAAHGVSAGSMTAANGGSFKDGFFGGAIGFGVGLPFGGAGGMIQGAGPGAIAARTAIAAMGGGVGSKLAGGSFADGAYSAAFFHLFNNEVIEMWEISSNAQKTVALYDSKEVGIDGAPIGGTLKAAALYYAGSECNIMDLNDIDYAKLAKIMANDGVHRVMIIDHSFVDQQDGGFGMQFGQGVLRADSVEWKNLIGAVPDKTKIVFGSCLCGDGSKSSLAYFERLGTSASKMGKSVAIYGYSSTVIPIASGQHGLATNPNYSPPSHWSNRQLNAIQQVWKR